MEKIIHCQFDGKDGFKFAEGGKCFTYNKNIKSKRKAYELATNQMIKAEHAKDK
jgi:hypothetical protein